MNDLDLARELAGAAERDLAALHGMGDPAVFRGRDIGFHAQQAAEKLLKAWLCAKGETYPLSHDLATLLDVLETSEPDVDRFNELVDYTRYAVRLRYEAADAALEQNRLSDTRGASLGPKSPGGRAILALYGIKTG